MMRANRQTSGMRLLQKPVKVEASLWRRFRFEAEETCRYDLFTRYRDQARRTAWTQFSRRPKYGLERPDFEQLAYEGLLQAIEHYDPLQQTPFQAYARLRIVGNIVDGLARSSEAGSQYTYRRRLEKERLRSIRTGSTVGSDGAVSELSDLVVDLALGLVLEGTGMVADETSCNLHQEGYETLAWKELQIAVLTSIARLPEAEIVLIEQHYLHGVAFKQLAVLMQLSAGRISQLHHSALRRLRDGLRAFE